MRRARQTFLLSWALYSVEILSNIKHTPEPTNCLLQDSAFEVVIRSIRIKIVTRLDLIVN